MPTLGELIERLKQMPSEQIVYFGFDNPHSYRGYYDQLAFEPKVRVPVRELLHDALTADGTTYPGWKGGMFQMHRSTEVWIARRGCLGEPLCLRCLACDCGNGSYSEDETEDEQ